MALRVTPGLMRFGMNLWPPFRCAGIRVRMISPDWRAVRVELRDRYLNRNYVGTHFGGSLFAMADPFHVVLLVQLLGREFVVWDLSSEIEFLSPGRGTVSAEVRIDPAVVESLRTETQGGARAIREFVVVIRDGDAALVARVKKRVYVRLKKPQRPTDAAPA